MSIRGRHAPLICSALLGALVMSCGGSPVSAIPPEPVPQAAQESAPIQEELAQAPESAQEGARTDSGARSQGGAQPESSARTQGGARPESGTPLSGRPGGAPPGVGHELPEVEDDLDKERTWSNTIAEECDKVHLEPDCLTLDVNVYAEDGQRKKQIKNPGPDYRDDNVYDWCEITAINPPTEDNKKIPAYSTVIVEVTCTPLETVETNPPEGEASTSGEPNGTDPSGQQSGGNKDETNTSGDSEG